MKISPKSNIENQQEIWEKWIEAQQLILDKNSQPIEIAGYQQPYEINPIRLQFKTNLKQKLKKNTSITPAGLYHKN